VKNLTEENEGLKYEQNLQSVCWKPAEVDDVAKLKAKLKELESERNEQLKILTKIRDKEFFEKCVRDQEFFENEVLARKRKKISKMKKFLEILEKQIRSNQVKFAQEVKELMDLQEKLERDKVMIQIKVLKMKQKDRLLDISQNSFTPTERNSYSKVGFLYKPSINHLYT
jgi:hypothetical protein